MDRQVPDACTAYYGFIDPCQEGVSQSIEDSLLIAGITAICVAAFQFICLVFSCCLYAKIPTKKEKEEALLDEARRLNRDNHGTAQPNQYGSNQRV